MVVRGGAGVEAGAVGAGLVAGCFCCFLLVDEDLLLAGWLAAVYDVAAMGHRSAQSYDNN